MPWRKAWSPPGSDAIFVSLTPPPVGQWLDIFFIMLIVAGVLTYLITKNPDLPESVREKRNDNIQIKNLVSIIDKQRLKQAVVAIIAFAGYVLAIGSLFTYIGCGDNQLCISYMPTFEWHAYYGAVALVLATLVVAILVGKDVLAD